MGGYGLPQPVLDPFGGDDLAEGIDDSMANVACEISDIAVEMMVDTGAQTSVISEPLARRLNLMDRVDTSMQGIAAGVGQARILGCIWGVPVKLGHVEFALDFMVLGVSDPLMILGIEQMRRYKCIVDLERKCLVFGGNGGVEVPFLPPLPRRRLDYRQACSTM